MKKLIYVLALFIIYNSVYGTALSYTVKISPELKAITSVGGTLNGSATVCSGNNSGSMNLTGYVGDPIRWEMSTTGGAPWITVIYPDETFLPYSNLTETTYFRAVVQNASEPIAYSSIAVITVTSAPVSGEIEAPDFSCYNEEAGTATISAYSGDIDTWQISSDNSSWGNISGTAGSSTISIGALTGSRYVRAQVSTGGCAAVYTESSLITVNLQTIGGNITGGQSVCKGSNSSTLTVNSERGDIVRWESSLTGEAPWNTIDHSTDNINIVNLVNSTHYRTLVQNSGCSSVYSASAQIQVDENTEGGKLLGEKTVCSSQNTGKLTLSDNTEDILRWEYSEDGGVVWQTIANTEDIFEFTDLITTTQYRAVVKSGSCPEENSVPGTITVSPIPTVDFNSDNVCVNSESGFTNLSSISNGEIVSYNWNFGNGNSSSIQDPVFTYTENGIYNVTLAAESNNECVSSITKQVEIYPKPNVKFTKTDVCLGNNAVFTNGSVISSGTLSYDWDFGDGNSTATADTEHNYSTDGTFNVTLTATSNHTCESFLTKELDIYPLPETDFSFENVCLGNSVNFENRSVISEGNLTYLWNFSDGSESTLLNPEHNFTSSGDYTVRLVSTSQNNCTDTSDIVVSVFTQPTADFSFDDDCMYNSIMFEDESNIDSGTLNYYCDFGDGQTSDEIIGSHRYSTPGTYQVYYKISSDNSCESSVSKTVNVFAVPTANFTAENECDDNEVKFNNVSTISSGSVEYEWDFNDSGISDLNNPNHLFPSDGIYNVRLIAVSNNNCSDTVFSSIVIYPNPVANFTAASVCDGRPIEFNNSSVLSSGIITRYLWDFGEGSNSVQQNPSKLYINSGIYNIRLEAYSDFGCSDTVYQSITVEEAPIADFSFENVCFNDPVLFNNNSDYPYGILAHSWDFNDNSSSDQENPQHIYLSTGIFSVKLKVTTPFGCVDSLIRNVIVYNLPNASAGEDTTISKGYPIFLNGVGGADFEWIPPTGLSNPYINNPEASPEETTEYVLMSTSENGCVNYDTVTVYVEDDFIIQATNVITPNDDGVNDTWKIRNLESYKNSNLTVYDRWGKMVYQKTAYSGDWDGRNKNNDILPDGTYYYTIDFQESDKTYRGCITILRN